MVNKLDDEQVKLVEELIQMEKDELLGLDQAEYDRYDQIREQLGLVGG